MFSSFYFYCLVLFYYVFIYLIFKVFLWQRETLPMYMHACMHVCTMRGKRSFLQYSTCEEIYRTFIHRHLHGGLHSDSTKYIAIMLLADPLKISNLYGIEFRVWLKELFEFIIYT